MRIHFLYLFRRWIDFSYAFTDEWVSRFINDNWRGMYRQLIAVTRGIWEPLLVDGANQMADHTDIPFRALMYFGDEEIYRIGE